ncbi:MAG TPA: TonB-dependent receptor, partial [Lamprocystis sp. (in: g-proteobacteria)]|nr:TonB-dependent receptor [Lamprocystis sp. (in: g-proteobacteria)]
MKNSLLLAALGLPICCPALAASTPAADEQTVLDPVIVTATRTPERADRTLASVSVIDRATIEQRQLRSVPDALRGLAGVTISDSGGVSSVFLRGTNSDAVLVLVDGVKVGSATLGTSPWADLPIQQIERIEVVRGPRSSLYGSKAIGGVIQIFTRRGGGDLTPRVTIDAGSFETAAISGGISGGGERGWFNLSGDFAQSSGFDACSGRVFPYAGCGVVEPDLDGYTQKGGSARAGYRFSERAEVDLSWLGANNITDFDGSIFSGNQSKTAQQVFGARARLVPLTRWVVTLAAGYSLDKYAATYSDGLTARVPAGDFDTARDSLSWQNDISIQPGHLLTLGVDYQRDRISGSIDYAEDSRDDTGVFGEYQGAWQAATLNLSLRQDDNQQFGTHTTGSAALGYRFAETLRTSVSYGTAFKAPTFNELYYPFFGNPDLDPEESNSLELGFDGVLPGTLIDGRWALNLYRTELDQMI